MTAFHSECVIEKENQIKDQNKNIREMESSIEYLQSLLLDDNTVQLYDPISQQYTSATMECVMNLDNLNVSNSNIPTVINEVLKLAGKTPDRLPSRSSVDNFVKAKGVIARKQVVDMLADKEGTTLYTDETRKLGKPTMFMLLLMTLNNHLCWDSGKCQIKVLTHV